MSSALATKQVKEAACQSRGIPSVGSIRGFSLPCKHTTKLPSPISLIPSFPLHPSQPFAKWFSNSIYYCQIYSSAPAKVPLLRSKPPRSWSTGLLPSHGFVYLSKPNRLVPFPTSTHPPELLDCSDPLQGWSLLIHPL